MSNKPTPVASHELWLPPMQQRIFCDLLHVFSYPGRVAECTAGSMTWLALLAALTDGEVALADPHGQIRADIWPRLEARSGMPETAPFIVADGGRAMDFQPCTGSLESPETGATLLLRVASLGEHSEGGVLLNLSGPGIQGNTELPVSGLHPSWLFARAGLVAAFPPGVDLLLCDERRFAALPRTTHIKTGDII
ncbi:MAG: phosphonate C-P lyase system protein PhnH [Desulfuromonadaceae bacterium]|nr:phosphonate C-P lyase system protein PhnH [Desulfuromonadaceae bacterium]